MCNLLKYSKGPEYSVAASPSTLSFISIIWDRNVISCSPHVLALSQGKVGLTARSVGCLCTVSGVTVDVLYQDGLQREKSKYK